MIPIKIFIWTATALVVWAGLVFITTKVKGEIKTRDKYGCDRYFGQTRELCRVADALTKIAENGNK